LSTSLDFIVLVLPYVPLLHLTLLSTVVEVSMRVSNL